MDGVNWIVDSGTGVYTPFPRVRDSYRSMRAHFSPWLSGPEPAGIESGMFRLKQPPTGECVYWGGDTFAGQYRTRDGRVALCRVRVVEDAIEVAHGAEGASLECPTDGADWRAHLPRLAPSPGYGKVLRRGPLGALAIGACEQ